MANNKNNGHFVDSDIQGTSGLDLWTSGVAGSGSSEYPTIRDNTTPVSEPVTPGSPTQITTYAQLQAMGDSQAERGDNYILMNDINCSGESNFTPIGKHTGTSTEAKLKTRFWGTFDGNGKTIINLTVDTSSHSGGLFGYIDGATIKDLTIEDATIDSESYSGGLVGDSDTRLGKWEIYNCHIINCDIEGVGVVGGLIGVASGDSFGVADHSIVSECSVQGGDVFVNEQYGEAAGGFYGYAFGITTTDCYSTATVHGAVGDLGGFVGLDDSDKIYQWCYSTGTVTAEGDYSLQMGGFAGNTAENTIIRQCWSTSDVVSEDAEAYGSIGGFVGIINLDEDVDNCYAWGDITLANPTFPFWDGIGGFAGSVYGTGTPTLTNCYSIGVVPTMTHSNVSYGGFAGELDLVNGVVIEDLFWDTDTSGQTQSAQQISGGAVISDSDLTGGTTSEMKTQSTYTGWDFDDIWYMPSVVAATLQSRTTAMPTDWSHLEGESVGILQDGIVTADQTVTSGTVTLTGTTNHVGLEYTSTLKPMKLDGEVNVKRIRHIIPNVNESLEGNYGRDADNMYSMVLRDSGDVMDGGEALHTGNVELPFDGAFDRQGNIVITQDKPLPMNVLGIGVNYSQEDI